MLPHSYQLPDPDTGWRWSPGWRTKRVAEGEPWPFGQYIVQRWTGRDDFHWQDMAVVATYAEARMVPVRWAQRKREAAAERDDVAEGRRDRQEFYRTRDYTETRGW